MKKFIAAVAVAIGLILTTTTGAYAAWSSMPPVGHPRGLPGAVSWSVNNVPTGNSYYMNDVRICVNAGSSSNPRTIRIINVKMTVRGSNGDFKFSKDFAPTDAGYCNQPGMTSPTYGGGANVKLAFVFVTNPGGALDATQVCANVITGSPISCASFGG